MRMPTKAAAAVFAVLSATSLAATGAFAQAALPGGDAAANNPYNAGNVDPAVPFGAIDIALAGATAATVQTWANTLSDEQKLELVNRCQVINANVAGYQPPAVSFCEMWTTAMANDPGATPVPGLGGANPATPAPAR